MKLSKKKKGNRSKMKKKFLYKNKEFQMKNKIKNMKMRYLSK